MNLVLVPVSQAQLANTKIAFVSDRDGNPEIYVMDPAGTSQLNLTNIPATDARPTWSPDGTRIVFASDRTGYRNIYVMNADGTNPINLTNHPACDDNPAWSPDGTKIAFDSAGDCSQPGDIYVMNADGTNLLNLTNHPAGDYAPSWSPDGTKIAFRSGRENSFCCSLWVMNANGSNPTRLTTNDDGAPSWSPDGTKIAFARDFGGPRDIYVMNANGTNQIRLTNSPISDVPSWSPDGTKIAFSSNRDGDYEIYVMNADGTNVTPLTNNSAGDYQPAWSPFIVLTVAIDIKPGSFPNSINLRAAGVVPVAILSSATFDATQVNPESVTLAGAKVKLIGKGDKYACHAEDVNGDHMPDLVCQVVTAQFFIEPGDSTAVLEAETFSGTSIRGKDSIRIVQD